MIYDFKDALLVYKDALQCENLIRSRFSLPLPFDLAFALAEPSIVWILPERDPHHISSYSVQEQLPLVALQAATSLSRMVQQASLQPKLTSPVRTQSRQNLMQRPEDSLRARRCESEKSEQVSLRVQ